MSVDIKWCDKELIKNVAKITDIATKKGAEQVLKSAKRHVSKDTRTLVGEIKVKRGKFNSGDWYVEAQGSNDYTKYYAIFVELGHYSSLWGTYSRKGGAVGKKGQAIKARSLKGISPIHIPKKPYLRPALNQNKRKIMRQFTNALDKMGVKENW